MVKILVASFNRASDGALEKLVKKMKRKKIWTDDENEADYILACGDRTETFSFVLKMFRMNKKIIHLWAGELTHAEDEDEVYRSTMTLMAQLHLCTNEKAKDRVVRLCEAVDKQPNAHIVGNVMLDSLKIDESKIPEGDYDLVLYNPPTRKTREEVINEINQIKNMLTDTPYMWIETNGDRGSELVTPYVTTKTLPRPMFLGALKNCKRFISNSSCIWYEAQFLLKPEQIIPIGIRNTNRESRESKMDIKNASKNIMKTLEGLK